MTLLHYKIPTWCLFKLATTSGRKGGISRENEEQLFGPRLGYSV